MKTPLLLTTLALSLIHPPIALPASIMRPPSLSEQLLVAPMLNCAEYVKYHEEHKIEFEESFIQGWLATITEICETEKGNILSEMVTDRISEKLPGGLNGHMRTGIYAIENNNANLLSLYLACDTKEQELYLRMHEESYITAKDQLEEKKLEAR